MSLTRRKKASGTAILFAALNYIFTSETSAPCGIGSTASSSFINQSTFSLTFQFSSSLAVLSIPLSPIHSTSFIQCLSWVTKGRDFVCSKMVVLACRELRNFEQKGFDVVLQVGGLTSFRHDAGLANTSTAKTVAHLIQRKLRYWNNAVWQTSLELCCWSL